MTEVPSRIKGSAILNQEQERVTQCWNAALGWGINDLLPKDRIGLRIGIERERSKGQNGMVGLTTEVAAMMTFVLGYWRIDTPGFFLIWS